MASSSINLKGIIRPIVLYCTLDDVITHLRSQKGGAVSIGDNENDSINRIGANALLRDAMRKINSMIRKVVGEQNIPLPRPVPDEIIFASICYASYLFRTRVLGGAEFTSDDIGNRFREDAYDAINNFIDNIETYNYLFDTKPVMSTAPRYSAGQDTILFPNVGIDGVEGGVAEQADDNVLPTNSDHTPLIDSTV